jgi:hypothetical protein
MTNSFQILFTIITNPKISQAIETGDWFASQLNIEGTKENWPELLLWKDSETQQRNA